MNTWAEIREMGTLRNLLHLTALLFILVLPFSEPKRVLEGWDLFFGGIVPATAPLVFIVMMFDVMMANVLKSEGDEERRKILQRVIRWHLVLGFLLVALWLWSFEEVLFR